MKSKEVGKYTSTGFYLFSLPPYLGIVGKACADIMTTYCNRRLSRTHSATVEERDAGQEFQIAFLLIYRHFTATL